MEVLGIDRCAGLDVHKKTVAACVRTPGDMPSDPTRRFAILHTNIATHPDTRSIDLAARAPALIREPPIMTIELT